jgi:hypothetical protein
MNIIDSEGKCRVYSFVIISDLLIGRPTNQSSFLLPQWGSIFVLNNEINSSSLHLSYNDLKPVFRNFATQLAALLGVPPVPLGLSMEGSFLSDWQLDALLRRRALQNVQGSQDTLYSIVKLVDQINNMPVGQVVRDDVLDALASLHEVRSASDVILMKTVLKQCRPIAPPWPRRRLLCDGPVRHYLWRHALSLILGCWHCCTFLPSISMQCIRHYSHLYLFLLWWP